MKGLEHINSEIEGAARDGVACWFPMGTRDERILRLPAKEAILLNSRCCTKVTACVSGARAPSLRTVVLARGPAAESLQASVGHVYQARASTQSSCVTHVHWCTGTRLSVRRICALQRGQQRPCTPVWR